MCQNCKGKGQEPFCAWCFRSRARVVEIIKKSKKQVIEDKEMEAIYRERVRFQHKTLTHMVNTLDKVHEDSSGVQLLLDNNY
jgi:hypothetical protein